MSSSRVRWGPRASAIVDKRRIEDNRSTTSSDFSSSMSRWIGYSEFGSEDDMLEVVLVGEEGESWSGFELIATPNVGGRREFDRLKQSTCEVDVK